MKFGVLVICILLAYEICSINYSINFTTTINVTVNEALVLKGSSTKAFPGEAFLNFILYGRTDVPFKYYDFISTYGYKTTSYQPGNLVIGNDGKLGGIVIDYNSVMIPVPKGIVTQVPTTNLKKYFSKGFTLLTNSPSSFASQRLFRSATLILNNNTVCTNCSAELFSSSFASSIFTDNNQILYNLTSNNNMTTALFGHLTGYDASAQVGNISVTFGLFNKTFLFTDPSSPNYITFAFKLLRSSSSGLVIVYNQKKRFNYTFSGTEY